MVYIKRIGFTVYKLYLNTFDFKGKTIERRGNGVGHKGEELGRKGMIKSFNLTLKAMSDVDGY